jgi:Concanavalin A-like lectin/glucanases superfamily
MSMSLVVLLPLILLGIVGTLCFVGCRFDTSGTGVTPFTTYTGTTVLGNSAIIAYWPLGETADTIPAAELISGNTGNYIDPATAAPLYPWLAYPIQNPPGPDIKSDAAPGAIAFAQPGIVKGDTLQPANLPAFLTPCVVVNGCYVEVPFNVKFVPQTSFTVEAWVRVDWTAGDPSAWRFVLDMRDLNPGTGFALFAKTADDQSGLYSWAGMIGNGGTDTAGLTTVVTDELTVTLSTAGTPADPVYLAMTFDAPSQMLTLFVNGVAQGNVPSATYMPNNTQPLWIGAGAPFVARRPQPGNGVGSPLFPFVGAIQDVAIYSAALTPDVIMTHFNNGSGNSDSGNDS